MISKQLKDFLLIHQRILEQNKPLVISLGDIDSPLYNNDEPYTDYPFEEMCYCKHLVFSQKIPKGFERLFIALAMQDVPIDGFLIISNRTKDSNYRRLNECIKKYYPRATYTKLSRGKGHLIRTYSIPHPKNKTFKLGK